MAGTIDRMAIARTVAMAFGDVPGVVAVAAAGSEVAGLADTHSDIDLYVYAHETPDLLARRSIAARFAIHAEVGNDAWEPGDEWIDSATGVHIDVMHRSPAWIEGQLDRVLVRHEASTGYSTCFWHNVVHSQPLVDPTGWYGELQSFAAKPYPPALKRAIVAKNHPILRDSLSSYLRQVELAVARADAVAVQHRVSAILTSYFDILFAVNGLPHPGEKRLVEYAATRCPKLPPGFEEHIAATLGAAASPPDRAIVSALNRLLDGLDALLAGERLLPGRSFDRATSS